MSVGTRQQAPPVAAQDSPGSAVSDSTGRTTPTSPKTPSTPSWPSKSFTQHISPGGGSRRYSLEEGKGRCAGPRDHESVGVRESMSQRGVAPRPASRRSSGSSAKHDQVSPVHYVPTPVGSDNRYGTVNMIPSDSSRATQHHAHKSLGVQNMLNPSEPRSMAPEVVGHPPRIRDPDFTSASTSSRPYGASRPFFPGHHGSGSLPGTPLGTSATLGRPSLSERNSPASAYPLYSALENSRKILSPKAPRTMSLGQALPPRELDPRQHALIPGTSAVKRPYEPDSPDEVRLAPGHPHSSALAPNVQRALVTPPRSLSQPVPRALDGPSVPPHSLPPSGDMQNPNPGLHGPGPFQHGVHGMSTSRPPSSMGGPMEGSSMWPEMLRRQGLTGALVGGEGQQAYMTLPGSDTPIPVQVDYSQASKKADEKRQRNAKASTRHRRKKKNIQEENVKQLQDLRDEREDVIHQLEDMIQQRDFYRDERNRLRDVVARTPAISKHAAGPPSPMSSRSAGSLADRSPMTQGRHMPSLSQGYMSEDSSIERPAQRRRTDERPEFSTPVYGPPSGGQPHGLPSIHGQGYAGPPRPLSAASSVSASGERLPPLRSVEGTASHVQGLVSGQPQEQDLRTGQWRPAQPMQYETGWATAPR